MGISWNARRFQKCFVRLRRRRHAYRIIGLRRSISHRTDDQMLVEHLLTTDALVDVFGVRSVDQALRLSMRVQRAKRRAPPAPLSKARHPGRNRHHLTPRCRKGEPYHGNTQQNLLVTKISRHVALHRAFDTRTWEEIVYLLMRCKRMLAIMTLHDPRRSFRGFVLRSKGIQGKIAG